MAPGDMPHEGLKILRAQAHVSSTPTVGTFPPPRPRAPAPPRPRAPAPLPGTLAGGYTATMTDDAGSSGEARARATAYVLQRYHLTGLQEARERLTPGQFAGVTRQIDEVEAQLTGRARPAVAALAGDTRGIATPFGRILPATGLLLIIIWLVFALETLQPGGSQDNTTLATLGATTPDLLATHQYWRLLTACFLHIGVAHIASNSLALVWLGSLAERFYGPLRFLGIYLAAGVAGNIAATVLEPGLGAGASGAIFGLLGAMLAGSWRNRPIIGAEASRALFGSLASLLVINIAISFIPGISKFAHFGGLLTGAALALLIPFRSPRYPRAYALAADGVSAILIVAALALGLTYAGAH